MQTVPIYQLKNELSMFVRVAEQDEEIRITRNGEEVACLVPCAGRRTTDRAALIRQAREKFSRVEGFDEREATSAGRKWCLCCG